MEKRKYLAPGVEALPYGAELMEVIETSPTPSGEQDAKDAGDVIDDEEIAAPIKDVWSDEEKKIDK